MAERIAPRRTAQAPTLRRPRGRFTQGELQRAPLESLSARGARHAGSLLARSRPPHPLLHALAHGYTGSAASRPRAELDELLARHGLLEAVEASERELLLSALSENRGALGRVAWALGLRGPELAALVSRLGLGPEVDRLREHFRKEALTPPSWTARLDLLGRRKYLEDLGLERELEDRLAAISDERSAPSTRRVRTFPPPSRVASPSPPPSSAEPWSGSDFPEQSCPSTSTNAASATRRRTLSRR